MGLPEDDRRALLARLAPAGGAAADVVAEAVDEDEELREIVVDAHGDVVAFTDRRALFVATGAHQAVVVGYDEVEVRRRDAGLAIDALVEGGRLILDVARGTFARLAVIGSGSPPGRATWLPHRAPAPRPQPEPVQPAPLPWMAGYTEPPEPPGGATYAGEGGDAQTQVPAPTPRPAPQPMPTLPPPGYPPPGWHPDPSGRHWWRWWDGLGWTDHVADGGAPFIDPLPPRE